MKRSDRRIATVFLDRDGVINRKVPEGQYVMSWDAFEVLPGVVEAIRRLNRASVRVIVVSNQRGVALGRMALGDVETIHARFTAMLEAAGAGVDAILFCPHDKEKCNCRKPLPGLYEQAVSRFAEIRADASVMIGDSLSDIEFAKNLGMEAVFIAGDPTFRKPGAQKAEALADYTAADLADAVDLLLEL